MKLEDLRLHPKTEFTADIYATDDTLYQKLTAFFKDNCIPLDADFTVICGDGTGRDKLGQMHYHIVSIRIRQWHSNQEK